MSRTIPTSSDAEFVIDAGAIAIISVAIMTMSQHLTAMTVLVCAIVLARFVIWSALPTRCVRLRHELLFFAGCLTVGAFNDWNSVVHHHIYDYNVPSSVTWSSIPVWMLIYWGLILRFVATLCRWRRLRPPTRVTNAVRLPGGRTIESAALRVGLLISVVVITRQLIYRNYADAVLSWLPFALALVLVLATLRPSRHDRMIILLFAIGGPVVEALYIQLGQLHQYQLGWLGGVPMWIALWWVLSVLIWKDVSGRILSRLEG